MRARLTVALMLLLVLGVGATSRAEAPPLIAYQGALSDAAGKPANGTFSVTLSMYEGPTGGAPVWTETLANIPVSKGVFSVILGASTPLPMGLANCNFLQVSVDGKAMLPRQRLLSVPYALEAQNAQTLGGEPASAFHDASNLTAGTIPKERLPEGAVGGDTPELVGTADIADGAVTTAKLAAEAVTGDKIWVGSEVKGSGLRSFAASTTSSDGSATALVGYARSRTGAVCGVKGETSSGAEGAAGVRGSASRGAAAGVSGWTFSEANGARGVYGLALAVAGGTAGVEGETLSPDAGAAGVVGTALNTGGSASGIRGETQSQKGGAGVYGLASATTGQVYGVRGTTASPNSSAAGVWGKGTGAAAGVRGETTSTTGGAVGVRGLASGGTGATYGVSGETRSSTGQASGVQGMATATDGATYGVLGITKSGAWEAAGVMGKSQGTQGHGVGVRGEVGKGLAGVMGFAKTSGVGVWGTTGSTVAGSAGVFGIGMATDSRNIGVHGVTQSSTGDGVLGEATYPTGENVGVHGIAASRDGVAVLGEATTTSPTGAPIGVKGVAPFGIGTVGEGRTGVVGLSEEPDGVGIWANASDPGGSTTALKAEVASPGGTAVLATAPLTGGGHALRVWGNSLLEGGFKVNGGAEIQGLTEVGSLVDLGSLTVYGQSGFVGYATFAGGHGPHPGDVAEHLRAEKVQAGDVVVIGPDGKLAKCSQECDTAVAGIVSTKPTMSVGNLQAAGGTAPLALVGVVPCKVDASQAPIKPGDLLVSSATPGHAMKCTSKRPAAGTVIGKALEALEKGTGVIQVLVTLR